MADYYGGKGNGLSLPASLGFSVPPTFAFSLTEVASWFQALPEWAPAIESWRKWSADAESTLEALRAAILRLPMPPDWAALCAKILDGIGAYPDGVMIRSSMSFEDLPTDSLAGAFLSCHLTKVTDQALWQKLCEVVASGFTREAALRILSAGLEPRDFKPGAIIQPFIGGKISGVCFSQGITSNAWMEWVEGAGEELVQGRKSSERFEKGTALRAGAPIASFVDELFRAAEKMDRAARTPLDLEWTWDGSRLWFLQARPIAGSEMGALALTRKGRRWTRELAQERFPEAMTPLGWSVIEDLVSSNLETLKDELGLIVDRTTPMAIEVRGWVYSDETFFKRLKIQFWRYFRPSIVWGFKLASFRYLGRRLSGTRGPVASALFKMEAVSILLERTAKKLTADWQEHVRRSRSEIAGFDPRRGEVSSQMQELRAISVRFLQPDLLTFLVKDSLQKALTGLWTALGRNPSELVVQLGQFAGNRTLEAGSAWKELVSVLKGDAGSSRFLDALERGEVQAESGLGPSARKEWQKFLESSGHLRTSWDIALPSWGESPSRLVPLLRASLAQEPVREVARWESPSWMSAIPQRWLPWLNSYVQRLQDFMRMDEELHFLSGMLLSPSRELVLRGGGFLAQAGVVEKDSDVFFLTRAELKASLEGLGLSRHALVQRRRSEWERSRKAVSWATIPVERVEKKTGESEWSGVPASPGVARGPAWFVEHIEDAREIPRGAILVTTSPNPSFVPIYPLLGGLLTATGGTLAHGFVAAREYALPAVSGFSLDRLRPGQWVEIDGNSGAVRPVEAESR